MDSKTIERHVMSDRKRPCLYGVAGPCFHPKCLNAHYETVKNILAEAQENENI